MDIRKALLVWLFFFLVFCNKINAQQYDKIWAVGSSVTTMAFEGDSIVLGYLQDSTNPSFVTMASICDSNGNFLFYTNGLSVYNRNGNIMPNGDSISYPSEYYSIEEPQGMASMEGAVVLPKPNDTNQYYIFHFSDVDTFFNAGGYESLNLYYSVVDMRKDSGRGDLVQKNIPLIQDELLCADRLAACQHANGRDWWIIKPAWHQNIYYSFLLTPQGVLGPYTQQIGPIWGTDPELPSYSCFSPDGSKYASVAPFGDIAVMDFDRCTGLFSNPESIYNDATNGIGSSVSGAASIAFSPNGRFLYANIPQTLNQYDLWSSPIYDSVRIETDTEFYQMGTLQLAPNGKIYLSCWAGGAYAIHVINEPDSLGLVCGFQLFGQPVLSANSNNLPYFPNFRLGPLVGSGCDTLTEIQAITDAHPAFASVTPNPASDRAEIIYYTGSNTANQATLYDISGRQVWSADVSGSAGDININLASFPSGIYMVRFAAGDHVLLNSKLVVMR